MMNELAELTKRESEIAELFAWGAAKKDIANRLYISERTVENHARNIYGKVGVTKVNELSAWWFCTKFKISFDLSPLKRGVIAMFFLSVISFMEIYAQDSTTLYRPLRTRTQRVARSRQGRRKNEADFDLSNFTIE